MSEDETPTTSEVMCAWVDDAPDVDEMVRMRQFNAWLRTVQEEIIEQERYRAKRLAEKERPCPNCDGTGKINFGNVIGVKDCPICLGERNLARADYMAAFGLFLQQNGS